MGKIVKFLSIFLIFFTLLSAGDLRKDIEANLAKIPYSSKKEIIKANNNLKNLYIKAIISEDEELQKKALEGIIRSSKILHFPYKRYEKAYEKLTSKSNSDNFQNKVVTNSDNSKKNSTSSKNKKTPSRIRDISFEKNSFSIRLNREASEDDLRVFDLNSKKRYIKVVDIKTNLPFIPPKIKLLKVDRVKIAQNKKGLVRVVLESKKPIDFSYEIAGDKIIFKTGSISSKNLKTKEIASRSSKPKKNKKKIVSNKAFEHSFKSESVFKSLKAFNSKKVIVIDPGHGGKDSGAVGYQKRQEKKAVLEIAKKLAKELKRRGFKVYLTRDRDVFINLRNRTKIANRKMADIFISIHANAAPNKKSYLSMKGVETYFLSPARSERAKNAAALENQSDMVNMDFFSKEIFLNFYNRERIIASNKLAIDVQAGILKSLRKRYKVLDGGVREGPFWVLVGAQMPAILIEVGYITNPTDAKRLFNPFFQKTLAKGIADGIESYFIKNR